MIDFCRSFLGFTRLKLIKLIWNMLPLLRLNNGFCFDLVHSRFFWTDLTQTECHFWRHKNLTILTKTRTVHYQKVKYSLLDNLKKLLIEWVKHILDDFEMFCLIPVKMLSFAFQLEVVFRSVLLLSIGSMFS